MFVTKPKLMWHMMAEEGEGGGSPDASDDGVGADESGTPVDAGDGGGEPVDSGGADGYWPGDWRETVSGGDEKLAKIAGRYTSPKEVLNALVSAQDKIRSGQLKSALPENPSDEELATWRQENGIPESPDKYDLTFDNGLVISDDDKPMIDDFLGVAHQHNLPPSAVKDMVSWYYDNQQAQMDQMQEADLTARQEATDELNVEWGRDYRRNVNAIKGLLDSMPEGASEVLQNARTLDGKAILNDPNVLRGFANLALQINPHMTVVPGGTGDPAQTISDEIKQIEKTMRENRTAYNKDEEMQARYRELLAARDQLKKAG